MKDKLYNILTVDNIVLSIINNFEELLKIILKLKSMIGFKHNHTYHHLDVFNHPLLAFLRMPKYLLI